MKNSSPSIEGYPSIDNYLSTAHSTSTIPIPARSHPPRAPLPLALAILLTLTCLACHDPVRQARQGDTAAVSPLTQGRPTPALPRALDMSRGGQECVEDHDCVWVTGLPGQRLDVLCCATCFAERRAMSRPNANLIATWRRSLDCAQIACSPPGPCLSGPEPRAPRCVQGRCE